MKTRILKFLLILVKELIKDPKELQDVIKELSEFISWIQHIWRQSNASDGLAEREFRDSLKHMENTLKESIRKSKIS